MKHIQLTWLMFFSVPIMVLAQRTDVNNPKKSAVGQQRRSGEISRFSMGMKSGLTQFYGELNEQDMKGSYGIFCDARITKGVYLGLDYSAGKLGGQKIDFFNSYFVTTYRTGELIGRWNLTRQYSKHKDDLVDISIYTGVGVIFFNANAFDIKTNELIRFSNSESSKRNQLFLKWGNPRGRSGIRTTHERIIPIGTTFQYNPAERFKLGLDFRFYLVRTDKLDATSGQRLINPEEKDSYSDTTNDRFSLLSVNLTHCFAKRGKR